MIFQLFHIPSSLQPFSNTESKISTENHESLALNSIFDQEMTMNRMYRGDPFGAWVKVWTWTHRVTLFLSNQHFSPHFKKASPSAVNSASFKINLCVKNALLSYWHSKLSFNCISKNWSNSPNKIRVFSFFMAVWTNEANVTSGLASGNDG